MDFKTNTSYIKSIKCADVYTESQTDYSIPDYLGDVRKILFTEATLRPSGRFAGGETVEFSGVVVYNVIYLDSEGKLCSAEFTSDYDYSIKCSGDNYNDSIADTRVSNYALRLTGPRKINAKASLVGSVKLSENVSVAVTGDAFEGENTPEINKGCANVRISKASSLREREFAESVARLEGAIADEVRVVHSFTECFVDDVKCEEERVSLKGRLRICSVISNGDEPAYGVEKSISFEENVDFEEVSPDMHLIPYVTVSSLKSTVNADDAGCEVVMSAILEMCVIGEGNQSVELVLDGYSTDCFTDNTYDSFNYSKLIDVASVKEAHSAEIDRGELEADNIREIVFFTSTPKIENVEQENGIATISGEIRYSGVASETLGDNVSYVGIKFTSPFAVNVNIDCHNCDEIGLEAEVHTSNTNATVDADKLYVGCNIECHVVATCDESRTVLSSMNRSDGDECRTNEAKITVYYPAPNETLFEVAKKFRTSCMKVAQDNDITESVFASDNPSGGLSGIKKLIIY